MVEDGGPHNQGPALGESLSFRLADSSVHFVQALCWGDRQSRHGLCPNRLPASPALLLSSLLSFMLTSPACSPSCLPHPAMSSLSLPFLPLPRLPRSWDRVTRVNTNCCTAAGDIFFFRWKLAASKTTCLQWCLGEEGSSSVQGAFLFLPDSESRCALERRPFWKGLRVL